MSVWHRRRLAHPSWCADGYRCTAGHAIGEHHSQPYTLTSPGGRAVAVVALVRREDRPYALATMQLRVRLVSVGDEGQEREMAWLLGRLEAALDGIDRAPVRHPQLPRRAP